MHGYGRHLLVEEAVASCRLSQEVVDASIQTEAKMQLLFRLSGVMTLTEISSYVSVVSGSVNARLATQA
jgi:hypothetical protein